MATAATRQEKNIVQRKNNGTYLTPTGLLMEGDFTATAIYVGAVRLTPLLAIGEFTLFSLPPGLMFQFSAPFTKKETRTTWVRVRELHSLSIYKEIIATQRRKVNITERDCLPSVPNQSPYQTWEVMARRYSNPHLEFPRKSVQCYLSPCDANHRNP
jgi:hypothetical protein